MAPVRGYEFFSFILRITLMYCIDCYSSSRA